MRLLFCVYTYKCTNTYIYSIDKHQGQTHRSILYFSIDNSHTYIYITYININHDLNYCYNYCTL